MRLSFYLDRPKSPRTVVMLNVALRGKWFRFSTGISLEPRMWDDARQTPRSSDPHRNLHRRKLNAITSFVDEAYHDLQFDDKSRLVSDAMLTDFRSRIQSFLDGDGKAEAPQGLPEHFQEFIDTYTLRTVGGQITAKRPSDYSLTRYRNTLKALVEWSKAARKPLDYDIINEDFYTSFCTWLGSSRGIYDATISNYIKTLKTFMKWARKKGYHQTTAYEQFFRDNRNGKTIALTLDELRSIRALDLSDNPRLARTRDHFLIQCYTGMRYGDLQKLEPHHIDLKNGFIRYTSQKTSTPCIVPITRPLREILASYPSHIFEFASSVKQNAYLKEIGERIDMDQTVSIVRYRTGDRVEELKKRSELLTTHVARRSFVSISVRFGIPESGIRLVTGHSASTMLQQHYIDLDESAIHDIVVSAWEQL